MIYDLQAARLPLQHFAKLAMLSGVSAFGLTT